MAVDITEPGPVQHVVVGGDDGQQLEAVGIEVVVVCEHAHFIHRERLDAIPFGIGVHTLYEEHKEGTSCGREVKRRVRGGQGVGTHPFATAGVESEPVEVCSEATAGFGHQAEEVVIEVADRIETANPKHRSRDKAFICVQWGRSKGRVSIP